MPNIQWKRGEFYEFRSTAKFHVGVLESDIYEDDLVEFDGQTLKYGGRDVSAPSLRAAVKAGWLVPSTDNVSRYIPQPAGVQVSPATPQTKGESGRMAFDTATEEEAVVGTLDGHRQRKVEAGATVRNRADRQERAAQVRESRTQAAPPPRRAPQPKYIEEADPSTGAQDRLSEDSGLVTVADRQRIEEANRINRARIAAALAQELPERQEYDDDDAAPNHGFVVVSDDQEGQPVSKKYKFSDGANTGAEGDPQLRQATKMRKPVLKPIATTPTDREPGRQTQVPREGNIDIAQTADNGATGDVDVAASGESLTDLLPGAAQGPLPDPNVTWDKSGHWRTRVKVALEKHGNDLPMLEAIKSVESPGVIKAIDKALAGR